MSPELFQAMGEIEALQRRLAEYAGEVQRLRDQGRECYVEADAKSTLNALEECRTERDKLKAGAKDIAKALMWLKRNIGGATGIEIPGDFITEFGCDEMREHLDAGLAKARELGLLDSSMDKITREADKAGLYDAEEAQ